MEQPVQDDEIYEGETSLVYAIAAEPGFQTGQRGKAFAAVSDGLLRSPDGGQTWEDAFASLALTDPLPVTSLALSPNGHVFAGAPGGVFRSKDGGESWQGMVFPSPPPTVSALAISPNYLEDETIFAGTMEDGVFISKDGGQRWVAWNFGFLDLNVLCLAVSPNYADDETLFAGTETGIFSSTNGGRAWREVELPFGYVAVISLAISPNYKEDETLFAGTEEHGLWVSTDSGETWQQVRQFDEPVNGILLHSSEILVINSTCLPSSPDGGQSWQEHSVELAEEAEISALLAPDGFASGASVLVGTVGGTVEVVTIQ